MIKQTQMKLGVVRSHGFVVDGYQRAIAGIESIVRTEVEQEFAAEWAVSGWIQRWLLTKKIDKEVAARVSEKAKCISPQSLF